MALHVSVLLSEPEVDGVDEVSLLAEAHQEVVRFEVSVDEIFEVNVFDPRDLEGGGWFGVVWVVWGGLGWF